MKLVRQQNGYYYIYYDRLHRESLKTKDRKEANIAFELRKQQIRDEKLIRIEKFNRIKLSQFEKEYIEGSNELPRRELHISSGTADNDRLSFKKFREICGDLPLRIIKRKQVDDFKARCLRLNHSPAYINTLLRSLRAGFNAAMGAGYISENPFQKKKNHPPVLFNIDEALPRFLSINEIKQLFEKITDPEFLFAIKIYLYTGLRRSELLRLQAQDIDWENNLVKVHKTKSKKARTVPIPDEFREEFRNKIKIDIGPLFPRWTSPDTMSRLFHFYSQEAKINARLHDLRHSYGTYLRMSGADLDEIQKLMGHSDIKTTQIYAKIVDEQLKQAANKLRFNLGGAK